MPRSNTWTIEQDDYLKNIWNTDTPMRIIIAFLRKAQKTIEQRAICTLNLPDRVACKRGKKEHIKEDFRKKFEDFIVKYEQIGHIEKALEGIMGTHALRHLLKLDPTLKKRYLEIRTKLHCNIICKYCQNTYKGNRFKINKENVCKDCAKDNSDNSKYTVEGRISKACSLAKRRHPEFDIDTKYLINLYNEQDGLCYYSNLPMVPNSYGNVREDSLITIDRKDSNIGYLKGDVVLATWKANRVKTDIPLKEFRNYCDIISNNLEYKEHNIHSFTDDGL